MGSAQEGENLTLPCWPCTLICWSMGRGSYRATHNGRDDRADHGFPLLAACNKKPQPCCPLGWGVLFLAAQRGYDGGQVKCGII